MIYANFITGPNTPAPLDLVKVVRDQCLGPVPQRFRQRAIHILPRRVKPTVVMQFDYPTVMASPEPQCNEAAAIAACQAEGTQLEFYLGAKMLPESRAERRKVLNRYMRAGDVGGEHRRLIFDQVADDAGDSPEADLVRQSLGLGFNGGLEANKEQAWINELMARFGSRITICAQWWLWGQRGRYSVDRVKALGGRPLVLVSLYAQDNDAEREMEQDRAAFNAFKVDKALEWAPESDVTVRMTGFGEAEFDRLRGAA